MLVTPETFNDTASKILKTPMIIVDTETTGLRPYGCSNLFSVVIKANDDVFYFDYNDIVGESTLCRGKHPISGILNPYQGIIFMHNAKFDMHFLANEGVEWAGKKVDCTAATARIEKNDHFCLKLKTLSKMLGESKSDGVEEYIKKEKLFQWEQRAGKKKREKHKHFVRVPMEVMQPYAEQDAISTSALASYNLGRIQQQSAHGALTLYPVLQNERRLTQVLYRMERRGVRVNLEYARECFNFYKSECSRVADSFQEKTGRPFMDSGKLFSEIFTQLGVEYPKTEKGNPSFDEKSLAKMTHPVAEIIKEYRDCYKRMGDFESLQYFSDDGVIHPDIKQYGCVTGRMSVTNPPLQCQQKNEGSAEKHLVRRCLVPRKGYTFFMMDYDQMEYRMMVNYAGQMDLIEKINGGLDVHTATGEMLGCTRKEAKQINFMLLYGGGAALLAEKLNTTQENAKYLKHKYFTTLPRVKELIDKVHKAVYEKGYVHNWLGRRYYLERDFVYKAPNYLIQGGCADWIKMAMVDIDKFLEGKKSTMLLQVHDELLFEVHNSELDIVEQLRYKMENVSDKKPHTHLPYTVGIEQSETSWQDKKTLKNDI